VLKLIFCEYSAELDAGVKIETATLTQASVSCYWH